MGVQRRDKMWAEMINLNYGKIDNWNNEIKGNMIDFFIDNAHTAV